MCALNEIPSDEVEMFTCFMCIVNYLTINCIISLRVSLLVKAQKLTASQGRDVQGI